MYDTMLDLYYSLEVAWGQAKELETVVYRFKTQSQKTKNKDKMS